MKTCDNFRVEVLNAIMRTWLVDIWGEHYTPGKDEIKLEVKT